MTPTNQALLVGIGGFVVGLLSCVAIFVALDVSLGLLPGPLIGVAIASHMAYKSALEGAR